MKGGAGELPAALVRRLEARGGRVRYHTRVEALEIQDRRAVAVRTADGQVIPVGRAVVGAVDAITLYRGLIGEDHLPPAVVDDLARFQFDNATVKVDWALDGPVPWEAEPARRAGTVHLTDSMDDLTMYNAQLACGVIPAKPLIVVGQMTTTDPTRSPAGTEVLWAYAHVPQNVRGDAGGDLTGAWTPPEVEEFADRIEARIETKAPGFGDRIRARHVMGPPRMQELNPSLVHGALNVGTAQLYQQLIFRPTPAMGRPTTPIRNVYLASGSAHPGGECTGRRARMPPPWPCAATPAAAWRPGPAASGPGAEPGRSRAARPGAGAAGPAASRRGRPRSARVRTGPRWCPGREWAGSGWWRSSGRPPVGQARRHPVGGQQQPGDGAGGGLPAGTAGTADDRGGDPFRGVGRRDGPQLAAGVVGRALEHGRVHRAGQDQADVDPRVAGDRLAQVEGQAAGGVLGHGVQRHLGVGHDPEQGPDDHQGPVALGLEGGQRGPGAEGGPDHVDVDQPLHGTGVGDVGRHRQHLDPWA